MYQYDNIEQQFNAQLEALLDPPPDLFSTHISIPPQLLDLFMSLHTHNIGVEDETSESGGLLEEIQIEERPTIHRRLEEFDVDKDTRRRWKAIAVPAMCLLFGLLFGISAGVLLAGGEVGGDTCGTPSSIFGEFNNT